MVKANIFVDGKITLKTRLDHVPRLGETLRINSTKFAKVIEVCWCLDEDSGEGQRVNIGSEVLGMKEIDND